MTSPAFQFYPDDFIGSGKVGAMSPAEVGIYVYLLCLDWNETGFEYRPKRLARFCRASEAEVVEAWEIVSECFVERDGRYYNPRLEREREKQAAYRARQSAAGLASAAARSNRGSTSVEPAFKSPSPSPAPATTGRYRALNRNGVEPEPYRPAAFCPDCGMGWGKLHPSDLKQVQLHKEECPRA